MSDHELKLGDLFGTLAPDSGMPVPDGKALTAVIRDLPDVDSAVLEDEMGEALAALLEIRIADVVLGVWSRLKEVREAADPRSHPPEEIVVVALARHTIISEHRPSIEIRLNDAPVAEVPVEVSLALTVEGLRLKIRDGRLRGVTSGEVRAHAALRVTGSTVLEGETPKFELPGRMDFGPDGVGLPVLQPLPEHGAPEPVT